MDITQKEHWENVYETKGPEQVSWTQARPETSLGLIYSFDLPKTAAIIDIGGGDSKLVDCLLEDGYENITVLDISARALDKAKKRLGEKAEKVKWVVCDITTYNPDQPFDVWHDRALFHFLTSEEQIAKYQETVKKAVSGFLVMGTFSENGPTKCSGMDIKQYSEQSLCTRFEKEFEKLHCLTEDHHTPFGTKQNFLFCSFRKK